MAVPAKTSEFGYQFANRQLTAQAVETHSGDWKKARDQWKDHLDGTNGTIHHVLSWTQKAIGATLGAEVLIPGPGWAAAVLESPFAVAGYVAATFGKAVTQTSAEREAMTAAGIDQKTIDKKTGAGRTAYNLVTSLNPFGS